MSNRKLVILAVAAAVMVVWAVLQSHFSGTAVRESSTGAYLIQGLETDRIESIVIGSGQNPVKLFRKGKSFVVANKESYPAETAKVNKLLASCLDIQTIELLTSDPANHEELEVTEEKSKDVVKFLDSKGSLITGIVVGKGQPKTNASYVRLITENNVYTAMKVPDFENSATDYINREIMNVDRDELVKVTVIGPESSYNLRADSNNGDFVLEDMPEGKKLSDANCSEVFSALSYLNFNDVKKVSSLSAGEFNFDHTYTAETKDSILYHFDIAEAQKKTYLKCSAQYTGDTSKILDSKQELKDKEAKLLARDRAADFTNRHKGWAYEIADWKAKKMTKQLDAILEDKQEQKKPVQKQKTVDSQPPSAKVEQADKSSK